jgi:hypothetical protein
MGSKISVHSVSGLLKLFLRELPDCILLGKNYEAFLEAQRSQDKQQALLDQKALLDALPDENRALLTQLLQFVMKVRANEKQNKMSVNNLAIVLGPNFLRPLEEQDVLKIMDDAALVHRALITLLEEYEFLFGLSPVSGSPNCSDAS